MRSNQQDVIGSVPYPFPQVTPAITTPPCRMLRPERGLVLSAVCSGGETVGILAEMEGRSAGAAFARSEDIDGPNARCRPHPYASPEAIVQADFDDVPGGMRAAAAGLAVTNPDA